MKALSFPRAMLLLGVIAVAGCAAIRPEPPTSAVGSPALAILDRLYFGGDIPRGGAVSEKDWAKFLAEIVTPRFPTGFTVLRGEGQWRDQSGTIVREKTFILEVNHPDTAAADRAVLEIIGEYKRRFAQEAVFRMRAHVEAKAL